MELDFLDFSPVDLAIVLVFMLLPFAVLFFLHS
jgi:hypothetical protein